jgi:undecaprenyl diphosphate synthase
MDGNGRWAENRGLPRVEGHRAGVETVKTIVQSCLKNKIAVLSLFAFSSENWARPATEVDFLMQLFVQALGREIQELHQHGVRLRFTGNRSHLSELLRSEMQAAEALTGENTQLILNIALNYGGKWDIVQAAKSLAKQIVENEISLEAINESAFAQSLNTADLPDPDLFIRTSGEQRISNFFLWQLAYTELYFSDILWPDFTADELEKALACFSMRKRRYGLTTEKNYV